MDALRFDDLARTLFTRQTRRAMLGLGAVGLLGALGLDDANAKKHKNKKCKKKCGPCKTCKKGKCKPKRAGTPCGTGKQCFANGECVACDVCANGCPDSSVQIAIGKAQDGATIAICAGTYTENLSIIDKTLTLIGAGNDTGGTILDGGGSGPVIMLEGSTITLRGLRITHGNADGGGGIFALGGSNTIDLVNCTVIENLAGVGGGIYNSGTLRLANSTVSGNTALEEGGGIRNGNGTTTLDARSRVTGNEAMDGGGIFNDSGTVRLANAKNVRGNDPNNCAGEAGVPKCEG